MVILPLDEEPALAEPPKVNVAWVVTRRLNIREELIVLERRSNHSVGE